MRFFPATWHLVRTMPWGVLIAACAVGLGMSLAAHQFASPMRSAAGLTLAVHAASVPVVAAVAFLASEPHRDLAAALPAPVWLTTAVHTAIALPVIGLTAYAQLELAATEFTVGTQGMAAGHMPWPSPVAEFVAWSATAAATAAIVGRTRWRELGGALAAPVTLVLIALLTAVSLRPAWNWWAVALAAAFIAVWESRDPWLRPGLPNAPHRPRHRSRSCGA